MKELVSLSGTVLNKKNKVEEVSELSTLGSLVVDGVDLLVLGVHSLDNSLWIGVEDIDNETVKDELLTNVLSWIFKVLEKVDKVSGLVTINSVLNSSYGLTIILLWCRSGSLLLWLRRKSITLEESMSVDEVRTNVLLWGFLTTKISFKASVIIEVSWDKETRRVLGEFDDSVTLVLDVDLNTSEFDLLVATSSLVCGQGRFIGGSDSAC